ncbi:MAG: hypothetical protein ACXAD7_21065 [Candidatus Kariarchaeaceae archaeon]|jgi:rRNA maturation protein Rpf1
MVLKGPITLITTSHNPSESARSFCKILKHVIPNSFYYPRGSNSLSVLHTVAIESRANQLLQIQSKGKQLSKMKIFEVHINSLHELPTYLQFKQFIDHKIFGWKRLPAQGPLSFTKESRKRGPELIDFLETHFSLEYEKKNPLWLMIDMNKKRTYIQFIDALTMRRFMFAEIQLKITKKGRVELR